MYGVKDGLGSDVQIALVSLMHSGFFAAIVLSRLNCCGQAKGAQQS